MRARWLRACLASALILAGGARSAAAQTLTPLPLRRGEIAIRVRVNILPGFTARASADSAAFTGAALADVRGLAVARVAEIHTGIGLLDGRMRRTLDAAEYPEIRFELLRVTPVGGAAGEGGGSGSAHGDTTAVTLYGRFTIRGVSRDDTIPGTVVVAAGALLVTAAFPLDIRDYGIAPPTAFFGIVRAAPVVRITVRLEFGEGHG
jgi:polyisoprenoid-binding protein YceI